MNGNQYELIGLNLNGDNVTIADNFGTENVPLEIKNFTGNKNIKILIQYKHKIYVKKLMNRH